MLPKWYRFHLVNNTGQTATFNNGASIDLRLMAWKFNSSGALVYDTVVVDGMKFIAGSNIVDGGSTVSEDLDNSSDLFLGLNGDLIVVNDHVDALGRWDLYVEGADGSGNFPSDEDNWDVELDATFVKSLRVPDAAANTSNGTDFSW